jgi:polysaccharide biosynthesis/export protein
MHCFLEEFLLEASAECAGRRGMKRMGMNRQWVLEARRWLTIVVCAAMALGSAAMGATPAFAQGQMARYTQSSDLARENQSRVAASAGEIKPLLLKDSGLMVELKRWIAKDATDHGQIVTDADLTNDAIFYRLENDVEFRAVATLMLQKYGYLVPEVNPVSEAGKEQQLLMQERVKWITQEEEEARQRQHQEVAQALQKERACATGAQADCGPESMRNLPAQNLQRGLQQQLQEGQPQEPFPSNPTTPSNPNFPFPGQGTNPLERAQLMETGGSGIGADFSDLGAAGSFDFLQGLGTGESSGASQNVLQQLQSQQNGERQSSASPGGLSSSLQGAAASLLLGGSDLAGNLDQNDVNPFATNQPGGSRYSPASRAEMQALLNRREQQYLKSQAPQMVRAANPYQDIPSLYDMYLQATPRPANPKRFGMDVFENSLQDPGLIPMDLPAGPDYVVGPGDGLAIDLWGGVSRKLYRTVDREGRVSIPEVGPLLVSGKSLAEVQQNLQQMVRTQFRDESADVSLARLRTIRVYEVGDVANPGAYDISSLSTPLNALFVAGGPSPQGSLRIVRHYRNNQLVETVDMYDLLLHGVRTGMERLDNGDTILVPPIGPQVTVEGMVRRPAIYELKDEKDLASVLELAGGLLPTAALRQIEVQRLVAHEKQTMLSLNIPNAGDTTEVTKKLQSFAIQDGDRIRIFPIASGNEDAVYLEGHVVRPGRYSYHADMRVTDVIGSFKDLLPEPASKYAEIIRLNQPDFHPSVENFDLADALANPSQAPILHPMDTVRIFSRFDFENPPSVSVLGDVRAPGIYQTSGDIHVADAVHLAGGLSPDAQTEDVQVFRYLSDGKSKIFSVNLGLALSGDPTENIILQPRDRLLIHKSPDAVQPGTVNIEGEVGKPGRYPLTTNMTVADLIRIGGGLEPSANTQNGDVTHYDWVNQNRLSGKTEVVNVSAALAGDPKANLPLQNGDVLTIGQLPGWNDLGASIVVKGEVKHPGTYGIRPGEKLSSILQRAGAFQPEAYPYGAVLERAQVRELESQQRDEMILRVKEAQSNLELTAATTPQQQQAREMTLQQYQTTLLQLSSNPPPGRVAIRITANIDHWKNTSSDIEVRTGDVLVIPKKPSYVMVSGQVFNPTAISYRPGKSAKWYLEQSGGPTQLANKKAIFVIRADGSVIGAKDSFLVGESFSSVLLPGDTVVVPEKAIGGGPNWNVLFTSAQVASSIVSTVFIATHY